MRPDTGRVVCFDIAVPIATPIATPIASQVPPEPKAASMAMPIPAPSAIPNPICIDGFFMSFAPLCRQVGQRVSDPHGPCYLPFPLLGGNASGLGDLWPIPRT